VVSVRFKMIQHANNSCLFLVTVFWAWSWKVTLSVPFIPPPPSCARMRVVGVLYYLF